MTHAQKSLIPEVQIQRLAHLQDSLYSAIQLARKNKHIWPLNSQDLIANSPLQLLHTSL